MKKIIIFVIAIVLLTGGYFLFRDNVQAPAQQENNSQNEINQEQNNQEDAINSKENNQKTTYEIIYTDSGYSPKSITIKAGETINFKNESSQGVWTASAMHPTHSVYNNTSFQQHCPNIENIAFDQCASSQPGESWSFIFNKTGSWKYHNHVNSSHFGEIIVE